MTPKEKAYELVEKFKFETKRSEIVNDLLLGDISVVFKHFKAKQCALIAVDEMLDFRNRLYINKGSLAHQYLVEIKKEIIKIKI
jgi:hypothetical protein